MTGVSMDAVAYGDAFLFVPGDRPERFAKAAASGADVVVLDLEDAVAPEHKRDALGQVVTWLSDGNAGIVRVNGLRTSTYEDEIAALSKVGAGIMLPKAEDAAAVARLVARLNGAPLILLVETALGIERALEICAVPGVTRAAFGSVDLAAQLGVDPTSQDAMRWARSRLVNASAAAGLPAPIDGVTTAVTDDEALVDDLAAARILGLSAKLCIHPRQVPIAVNELGPSADAVAWSERVLGVTDDAGGRGGGVTVIDGQMIDAPVVARARRIAEAAARRQKNRGGAD